MLEYIITQILLLRYSKKLDKRMERLLGILMRLTTDALNAIREDFNSAPGRALDVIQFIEVIKR
jgi:hypothetical protein